jgi:hypothetical protein
MKKVSNGREGGEEGIERWKRSYHVLSVHVRTVANKHSHQIGIVDEGGIVKGNPTIL